jgi:hypothetical protein
MDMENSDGLVAVTIRVSTSMTSRKASEKCTGQMAAFTEVSGMLESKTD